MSERDDELLTAYNLGLNNYHEGITDNPYKQDPELHESFMEGWKDAQNPVHPLPYRFRGLHKYE